MNLSLKHVLLGLSLSISSAVFAQSGSIVPSERELQQMQEQEQYDARDKREQAVLQKNYFSLGQAAKEGVNPMKDFVASNLPEAKGDDQAKQDLTGFEMLSFAVGGFTVFAMFACLVVISVRKIRAMR